MKSSSFRLSYIFILLNFSPFMFNSLKAAYLKKANPISISGVIIEEATNQSIFYANIVLYTIPDSNLVKGVATDQKGFFIFDNLKEGNYFISIQSLGYDKKNINDLEVSEKSGSIFIDTIKLKISTQVLKEVEVRGNRSTITFESDKKILRVGSDIADLGGTAIDAVKKFPSVQVDYEGNVSIRGNNDFKVLINGKPTSLSGQEELKKIPVNMIKKIELISNASVEYNTEGLGTIINVITVKQVWNGSNGMVESAYNLNNSYNGGFRIGYKKDKVEIQSGLTYKQDNWKYRNEFYQTRFNQSGQILSNEVALGKYKSGGYKYMGNLGIDIKPDTNNIISISGSYTYNDTKSEMDNNYISEKINIPGVNYSNSLAYRYFIGPQYSLNGNYERSFSSKNHKLSVNAYYSISLQNHDNSIDNTSTDANWNKIAVNNYYYRVNYVNNSDIRLSCTYEKPINDKYSYKVGYEYNQYRRSDASLTNTDFPASDISIYDLIPVINGDYVRKVHAIFSTFNGSLNKLDYKLGLRTEAYIRDAVLNVEPDQWHNKYYKLFPSVHLTYNFENQKKIAASFSRRTYNPDSWMIFKMSTYHNKNYVFIGNPKLEAMFTNNMELSFSKKWEYIDIYSELFYTNAQKSIQMVFIPDSNDVRVGYPINFKKDYRSGSSNKISFNKIKWLNLEQGFDIYYNELTNDKTYTSLSYNVTSRINITISNIINITMNANYYSPTASSQGMQKGRLYSDIGISKKLFKNNATIALSMWDPFRLTSFDSERKGIDYNDRYYYYNDYLNFNIYFSYSFNNYSKNNRNGNGSSGNNPTFQTQ